MPPIDATICLATQTPTQELLHKLWQDLSVEEHHRAERYRFRRDRDHFVWRRALLRRLISARLDVGCADLRFRTVCPRCGPTAHGKPELIGADAAHFSTSQRGEVTAIA